MDPKGAVGEPRSGFSALAAGRLLPLAILCLVQLLYFPINRTVQGGVVLATSWDAGIPLWPIWVVPYLLSLAWWAGSYLWAAWRMPEELYQALVVSAVSIILVSYVIYILFPTYVVRPPLEGAGWPTRILAHVYANDRVYNAFPSGHTYNTVLIALYWSRWQPRLRWLWAGLTLIVLLSTLFTRQHNLPDLLGGAILAWLGYRLGLGRIERRRARE
jgi:membrane-associated phospholipid phosphatase